MKIKKRREKNKQILAQRTLILSLTTSNWRFTWAAVKRGREKERTCGATEETVGAKILLNIALAEKAMEYIPVQRWVFFHSADRQTSTGVARA